MDRWWAWMVSRFPALGEHQKIRQYVLDLEVMPSMRLLMTAGEAVDRDNTCAFNCSYLEMDDIRSFSEQMHILMCGTGVGYGVEQAAVSRLPHLSEERHASRIPIVVQDSKEGWADAYYETLRWSWDGVLRPIDTSLVRPAGSRLKTFGGRASGPEPLVDVLKYAQRLLLQEKSRAIRPLEVLDMNNVAARSVIVGGVRRSAQISLSDLSDREIALCKSGNWFDAHPYRALSNNSAVYEERPSMVEFLREWSDLYLSYSGERGIFNRGAARKRCAQLGRDPYARYGTNPCGEILLLPKEFCNLSEVIIKPWDTEQTLRDKVIAATILGTCQSALTYFPYLRPEWRANCENERLLGVSMTGIYDNPLTYVNSSDLERMLDGMRQLARNVNADWAATIGINPSVAITCVKPSGTVSCLADSASGIHPRYARFYIRRVRIDKKDPLYQLLKDQRVPVEDCVMNPSSTAVFSFPMRAPENAVLQSQVSALEHLRLWQTYKRFWCDHNPSITVNYSDEEFLGVGSWVYENFDDIQGISFLPRVDHVYAQAPYEPLTETQYHQFPKVDVDFSQLVNYEHEDGTVSSHTMACSGGSCEIVDLVKDAQ